MRKVLFASLAACLTLPALAEKDRLPGPIPARIVQVIDGDTIEVAAHIWLSQDVTTRVRLAGIDTPELRGKECEAAAAQKARRYVEAKLPEGAMVTLWEITHDKYANRIIARLELADKTDLSQSLLKAGLAQPYQGKTKVPWC